MAHPNKDLCPEFSGIKTACHKRKVYDICVLFAMENYEILKLKFDKDMFPSNKYYTLEDKLKGTGTKAVKKNKKITAPPKNKRSPVVCSSDQETSDTEEKVVIKDKDKKENSKEKSEEKSEEKPKRKTYPISINRNAKNVIDFIIGRFLWEIYTIELDENLEDKSVIEKSVLELITTDWTKTCNISELIINSVNTFKPNKIIKNSHGLAKELKNVLGEHLKNSSVINFVSWHLSEFIKLLMLFFSNRMWLEKTQTINLKIFENVLRDIELSIPAECKTVSNGLMDEIYKYDDNIIKSKPKSVKKSDDKKSEDKKETKKTVIKKSADKKETKKTVIKKSANKSDDSDPEDDNWDDDNIIKSKPKSVKKSDDKKSADKKETKKTVIKKSANKSDDSDPEDDNWDDDYESN
jgi:hypothetical protein